MPHEPPTYRTLIAWQLAMDLSVEAYRITCSLPTSERYGLTSQIRRASASVPANIAEGYGRGSKNEFRRFLDIANGSLKELETHIELAVRVNLWQPSDILYTLSLADRVGAVLRKLRETLR